jgi:hypothetical protein
MSTSWKTGFATAVRVISHECHALAQLLQHRLLQGSFVARRPIREFHDMTRHRVQPIAERIRARPLNSDGFNFGSD